MDKYLISLVLENGKVYHEDKKCRFHVEALNNISKQLEKDNIETGYKFQMYIDDDLITMSKNGVMIIRNAESFYVINLPKDISIEQLKYLKQYINVLYNSYVVEIITDNNEIKYINYEEKTYKK